MKLRRLLIPLSAIFWLASAVRRIYYKRCRTPSLLPGVTISVGNICVGGTGKSPITMSLAQHLCATGYKPAVLTRGYRSGLGRRENAVLLNNEILLAPQKTRKFFADEARMQAATVANLPVIVGQNRLAAAKRYLVEAPAPTHWILDDGMQHLKIHRNIDLVCLDAEKPYSDSLLLPAGSLREPINALNRAHALIFTRYRPEYDQRIRAVLQRFPLPHLLVPFSIGTPYHAAGPHLFTIDGQPIRAVSGIANDRQFIHGLLGLGLNIVESIALGDHRNFTVEDLRGKLAQPNIIVTTAKDYWRNPELFALWGGSVYIAPLKTDISSESWDRLFSAIEQLNRQKNRASTSVYH